MLYREAKEIEGGKGHPQDAQLAGVRHDARLEVVDLGQAEQGLGGDVVQVDHLGHIVLRKLAACIEHVLSMLE